MKKMFIVFTALLLCFGCSTKQRPLFPLGEIDPSEIPKINIQKTVSVNNDQHNKKDDILWETPYGNFSYNRHQWTQQAVDLTVKEFEKRNVFVNKNGEKTLDLSILNAIQDAGHFGGYVKVWLEVKAGNGYNNTYQVKKIMNLVKFMPQHENCVYLAVVKMFNDPEIIKYLEN